MNLIDLPIELLTHIFYIDENYEIEKNESSNIYMNLKVLISTCKYIRTNINRYIYTLTVKPDRKFSTTELKYAITYGSLDFLNFVNTYTIINLNDSEIVQSACLSRDYEKFKVIVAARYRVSMTVWDMLNDPTEPSYRQMRMYLAQHTSGNRRPPDLVHRHAFLSTNNMRVAYYDSLISKEKYDHLPINQENESNMNLIFVSIMILILCIIISYF
jgi:hypothetical protein